MQSRARRFKRMMQGFNTKPSHASKIGKDKTRQEITLNKRTTLVETYLTNKGIRLKTQGAPESVLSLYRKNRYAIEAPAKARIKVIYHKNHIFHD